MEDNYNMAENIITDEIRRNHEPVISFKNAEIMNGESPVIYNLNMDIYPGDFLYIVGKVGTGKTSIIRTMIAENRRKNGSCDIGG